MNYFSGLYSLIEIAINNNVSSNRLRGLKEAINNKDFEKIRQNYPEVQKFIPYCKWYIIEGQNMLCMSAYIYDIYTETGILPDLTNYDINPNKDKLEYWQYITPISFEINPSEGFEFANKLFETEDIWNLFLSGSARMDYYQGEETTLEQRIKYAIVEYMIRRPQFYTIDDFVDNPILHKKYKKKEG